MRHRVLVIEDEKCMQELYSCFFEKLHKDEFLWFLAPDGDQGLRALTTEILDLVILDLGLPGLPGLAILKALRAHPRTRALGVLVVSAKSSPSDTVTALESGADDCLFKPFDEKVLLARLHSLIRRKQLALSSRQLSEFPWLKWYRDAGLLLIENNRVHINPKESDLLNLFLARPNMIHSHQFLWDTIWGYESENWKHILITTLSSLRRKLGSKWGSRLQARKKVGYLFNSGETA